MAGLNDLLSWADNKRRVVGRNLSDLVNNPGDSFKMIDDRAKNYNQNVQPVAASGSLYNRPMTEEEIQQKHIDMALDVMPMGVGHIAYHGSPHKFDKFSLDKIGTGEGAQAYGHGMYLAEKEGVAQDYAKTLGIQRNGLSQQSTFRGESVSPIRTSNFETVAPEEIIRHANEAYGLAGKSGDQKAQHVISISRRLFPNAPLSWEDKLDDLARATKDSDFGVAPPGNLYKTDIPDEAVARFLDWDKPLSQQQPDVLERIKQSPSVMGYMAKEEATRNRLNASHPQRLEKLNSAGIPYDESRMTGKEAWTALAREYGNQRLVSERMQELGIPGIRYLDGGSRSAGQGSSNFVAFDPEMIRILERNGVATGNVPWKPGEYRPLNDLMDVRKD